VSGRQSAVARRAEAVLGRAVVSTSPVAGGDVSIATKLRLSDGTLALMKTHARPPAGFFPTEAAGLRWLAEATASGGVAVPEVLAVTEDCLVLAWVEQGRATSEGAEAFGRALAATHALGADRFGANGRGVDERGEPRDGFLGPLPLPQRSAPTWAEFYAVRRLLPYLKLARDRGRITPEQAASVEALVPRLPDLVPAEPPARIHGDLWNGNVLWGVDGGAWLVDPAAYAGHREVDLAMLSLFGLPQLARVLAAYAEAAPLADGWEDRLALHQIFPLLVHAVLFGGGYAARAAELADRYR